MDILSTSVENVFKSLKTILQLKESIVVIHAGLKTVILKGGEVGKAQRKKGHDWERFVANKLQEFDPMARRNLEEYREIGGSGRDILTKLPFCIQCKSGKQFSKTREGLKEALKSAKKGEYSVCITKVDYDDKYVTMRFDEWWELVREWLHATDSVIRG